MRVADAADDDAAERARQEPQPVGEEGREQRRDFVARGEKLARDVGRHEGIDREVVPFEHVADDGGGDGSARLGRRYLVHGFLPGPAAPESPRA
jgi:hypothetical protein